MSRKDFLGYLAWPCLRLEQRNVCYDRSGQHITMTATEEATPEQEFGMAGTLGEAATLILLETCELRCFLGVEHCVGMS